MNFRTQHCATMRGPVSAMLGTESATASPGYDFQFTIWPIKFIRDISAVTFAFDLHDLISHVGCH
ncbi:MAG: hypothetical protein ACJ8G3_13295 [Burkholderiaceae bacterium]